MIMSHINLSVDSLMYCDNVLFVIKNVTHFTPFIHKESIFIEKKNKPIFVN